MTSESQLPHPTTSLHQHGPESVAPNGSPIGALGDLFDEDRGSHRMHELMADPTVQDIRCNRHDRIFYSDSAGTHALDRVFQGPAPYVAFIERLLALTDAPYRKLDDVVESVIEGSFRADVTSIRGTLFVATQDVTRGEPVVVIRKQPTDVVTLDQMLEQGMMSMDMRIFLEIAMRGRLNILVSGGSGAGKTTMARALSWYIDPSQRVITAEDHAELHLDGRLPNAVSLTTHRKYDHEGRLVRQETLEDLVTHALRMRGDRIWIGETRGREAYALVKACLSGHDGSVTTIHANNTGQAIRQLVSYIMEAGVPEQVARDQVSAGFHIAIQIQKIKLGRRVITEIVELENVQEGTNQRRNELWRYNPAGDHFEVVGRPSPKLRAALERYNTNYDEEVGALMQRHIGTAR